MGEMVPRHGPRLLTSTHRLHGGLPVGTGRAVSLSRLVGPPQRGGAAAHRWIRVGVTHGKPGFGMRSVQVKCRMKLSYPNASEARFAMMVSSAASENPRDARQRAVFGVLPRAATITSARAVSG